MLFGIGCLLFTISIILLVVGAFIHTPRSAHWSSSGNGLIATGVFLLFVSAAMMVGAAVLSS